MNQQLTFTDRTRQLEASLNIAQAIEAYKLWCQKHGRVSLTVDSKNVQVAIWRNKEVVVLRAMKGYKLAMLLITREGLKVIWGNNFIPRPRLPKRRKYLDF